MQVMKWSVIALAVAAGTSQMAVASSQCHQLKEFSYKYHIISAKFSA